MIEASIALVLLETNVKFTILSLIVVSIALVVLRTKVYARSYRLLLENELQQYIQPCEKQRALNTHVHSYSILRSQSRRSLLLR